MSITMILWLHKQRLIGCQVAVSKELGIHVNTIRSYESNSLNQIPKIEQLMKIKNYYNVSYEYLLGEIMV